MAKIETIRHSLSHMMASAVQELFPGTKFGIGPAIENGFYYDFDLPRSLNPDDLRKIEGKMKNLIKENIVFTKKIVLKEKAKEIFKDQPYKLELIEKLPEEKMTIYQSGNFTDLCKGPHLKSTLQLYSGQAKEINDSFKLTKIAGAYWKGNEKNKMLTRIYGIAFETKKELEDFLRIQEEAGKRDHRILGQKLDLFSIDEEVGPGLILWHPKGAMLRQIIEDFWIKQHLANGYQIIRTPHVGRIKLWQTSGHTNFYKENMFGPMEVEGDKYLIKPMNCPFAMKIYNSKIRSYRDLPIRWGELGTVYRYELSGVLYGLTRVRGFTQDDAHIICVPEQLTEEVMKAVRFGIKLLKAFGFKEYSIYLATRPEKYVGTLKNWGKATRTLEYVLNKLKLKYKVDAGGGVFYGPKIDIKIKDSLGREWQCTTVQFDFNLPERFNMTYVDKDGKKKKPYMAHRTLLGSLERFVGVLLEHYAGALPLWLAPEQIWIIPVGSRHVKYANFVNEQLTTNNLRTQLRDERETVSKKIREGEMQKIPYLLVVGDKEMKSKSVRIRQRGKGDIGEMKLKKFFEKVKMEVEKKK
jgi:threonyl-tRNA synthetase